MVIQSKNIPILILMLSLLSIQTSFAQSRSSLLIEGSQTFPTFRFIADNNTDNHGFTNTIDRAFSLGYLYDLKHGIVVGGDIGLYNGGATKVFGSQNYTWDLRYLRAKINLGYVLDKWLIKPFVLVSPYYGYLLKATESIGSAEYDLGKGDYLSSSDFGIVTTGGARVKLSRSIQTFAAYSQTLGLLNIETNPGQKLYNRGFSLSLGLVVNIPDNYAQSNHKY